MQNDIPETRLIFNTCNMQLMCYFYILIFFFHNDINKNTITVLYKCILFVFSYSHYLTIRLRARDFYEMIVDEGEARINCHLIEIERE